MEDWPVNCQTSCCLWSGGRLTGHPCIRNQKTDFMSLSFNFSFSPFLPFFGPNLWASRCDKERMKKRREKLRSKDMKSKDSVPVFWHLFSSYFISFHYKKRVQVRLQILSNPSPGVASTFRFDSLVTPGLDWTRIFISLTAGAGTR